MNGRVESKRIEHLVAMATHAHGGRAGPAITQRHARGHRVDPALDGAGGCRGCSHAPAPGPSVIVAQRTDQGSTNAAAPPGDPHSIAWTKP